MSNDIEWKLVPVKPTIEMIVAGRKRIWADMTGPHMGPSAEWAYEAMIAAAPEPPTEAKPKKPNFSAAQK